MPVHAEDAIWGATDKEMVRCRGSFSYAGWTLCGGKKPSFLDTYPILNHIDFTWTTPTYAIQSPFSAYDFAHFSIGSIL